MTTLFTVDFENNKLFDTAKGFDIVACWGGTIEVNAASKYEGTYGIEVTPLQGAGQYQRAGGAKRVTHLTRIRQAFYLHPHGVSIANDYSIKLARDYHRDASMMIYQVHLYYLTASGYYIYAGVANNTGGITSNSSNYLLPTQNGWNLIEFNWTAGNPGNFQLWIDGVSKWNNTTIVNDELTVNYPALGMLACSSTAAVSGSIYLDYWRANDNGDLIGA
jgi:hypothetical protein